MRMAKCHDGHQIRTFPLFRHKIHGGFAEDRTDNGEYGDAFDDMPEGYQEYVEERRLSTLASG